MKRDLIVVVGNQGCGKSVWSKAYAATQKRLFVSDPLASFPGVDFMSDPNDILPRIFSGEMREFRFGTYDAAELPLFGHAAYGAGDCTFVIEECALMFRRGADLDDWAKRLVFMGRHQRVNLVLVAQRAVKVPLDVRSQATRIVTFRQTDPNDIDAISEVIGGDYEDTIRALPELHCVDWNAGKVSQYSIHP
jgi:hypothetical protein